MPNARKLDRFLSMGDICREFSVTSRAIRFYEEMGLLEPQRRGTTRVFTNRERTRLQMILAGKRMRLPIRDIADILALRDPDDGNLAQSRTALEKLNHQRSLLLRERDNLEDAMEAVAQACEVLEKQLRRADAQAGTAAPLSHADAPNRRLSASTGAR